MIVHQTNQRAQSVYHQWNNEHEDNQKNWENVDAMEIYGFLGLLLLCGVYRARKEPAAELWSDDAGFMRPGFIAAKSCAQLTELKRFICFDDQNTRALRREADKLAAIRDVVVDFFRLSLINQSRSSFHSG